MKNNIMVGKLFFSNAGKVIRHKICFLLAPNDAATFFNRSIFSLVIIERYNKTSMGNVRKNCAVIMPILN